MSRSVLFVDAYCPPGRGSHVVSRDIAGALPPFGWQVFTTSHASGRTRRLWDMIRTTVSHRGLYDVAHISLYSGSAFAWAEMVAHTCRLLSRPFVITLHGGKLPEFAARWPGRVRRLLRGAGAVTSPSRYLRSAIGPYCNSVTELPNPLDLRNYRFRERAQINPRLIWLRAFHRIYQPSLAIDILARVRREYPNATLEMIGPDKGDGSLQETQSRIRDLHLQNAVTLVGAVPKSAVPCLLDQADVFLNTSTIDNTPVSVLEAMATGLCIVSTDAGGLTYLLDDGVDARIVPVGDGDAAGNAVLDVLRRPEYAVTLSQNARAKALGHDSSKILPQWDALLGRLAGTRWAT